MTNQPRRARHRLIEQVSRWAWSEIAMLRVALVLTYLAHVYFSFVSFFAGVPVFAQTARPEYVPVWAILLGAASAVAAGASSSDRWRNLELIAGTIAFVCMLAYVGTISYVGFVEEDETRQAVGAGLTSAVILVAFRVVWLAAQLGKRAPR